MKRFSQQFKKQANTVMLREADCHALRERVVSYMEYHPLPKEIRSPISDEQNTYTEAFRVVRIPYVHIMKWSGMTALILLALVPLMAERAVPGDTLYAVKVRFNEEVRSTLTFTPTERVEWETARLNRRIAEARLLASEGRLTNEVEVAVADAVREHTENAKAEIENLRATDADQAAIVELELATTLEVQATTLMEDEWAMQTKAASGTLAAASAITESTATKSLIATAIAEVQSVEETDATTTPPAYAKLVARVELNTTRARELYTSLEGTLSDEDRTDLERRLADVERAVAAALALAGEDKLAARFALIEVLQRTQRLIVFMTNLEVANSVSIDDLVPVVLTDEEKTAELTTLREEIASALETIDTRFVELTDASLREKATGTVARIVSLQASSSEAQRDGALDAALSSTREAHGFALDTARMIELALDPVVSVPEPTATSTSEEVTPELPPATTTATSSETTATEVAISTSSPAEATATPATSTDLILELPPATSTATSGEVVDTEN